ncbi:heme peroxidase [Georgenia subflava]|uniref:Heme peroxidase n=1 Tax=Georgenia subflava TaxID=1622177 RepID=A0A6N7EFC8_9MICO|nr:heme peroxidase [Georgenia subflava]MPV35648.1 heme peroxidase [Georgenia subflava]
MTDNDVDKQTDLLITTVEAKLPPSAEWTFPGGYPNSLALGVIDAIQSMGVRYGSVVKVVSRYCHHRDRDGGDAYTDGLSELRTTFDELGVAEWSATIGNGHRTSTAPGAPLKAEAIYRAANALTSRGINSVDDLQKAASNGELDGIKAAWRAVPGQKSGISWRYLLMLAGVPGVKPDRMIRRFVEGAAGKSSALTDAAIATLVERAAEKLDVSSSVLDHTIWRHQSGREVRKPMDRPAAVSV